MDGTWLNALFSIEKKWFRVTTNHSPYTDEKTGSHCCALQQTSLSIQLCLWRSFLFLIPNRSHSKPISVQTDHIPDLLRISVLGALDEMSGRVVFTAVYGPYKPYKKHKQWTGDGKFIINNGTGVLVDEENGRE